MKATLTSIMCGDLEMADDVVPDPTDVEFLVQFWVSDADEARTGSDVGQDMFSLLVITPKALKRLVRRDGPQSGRHMLIIDRWDWEDVQRVVREHVASVDGADWDELATKLGRWAKWEFEDYVEPPAIDDPATAALLEQVFGPRAASTGDRTPAPPDEGRR
ncbi:MAG: Imm8 family immunity protein [Jatrophihabitans sp.]|uniref:Imm8 family immunity protein n=1 Tax=Jatrophihabitans sp. TaxID=1932789 RepID=UPI003F81CF9C